MFTNVRRAKGAVVTALSLLMSLAATTALAVGLGEIQVRSGLNEPLDARIPLLGLAAGQSDDLKVRLADQATFDRAGLERSHVLTQLQFEPTSRGGRRGYVRVRTRDLVREPVLSFIVEASTDDRVVQRRYDVLLNLRQ